MSDLDDRIARLSPEQRARLEQELLARAAGSPPDAIPRRPAPGPWPLSFAQERLWLVAQAHPESPLYNEPLALRLQGPLSVDSLERALRALVERHETLRTVFRPIDGEPRQESAASWSVDLPVVDLRDRPVGDRELEAHRRLAEAIRRPFRLTTDLPFRTLLLRLDDQEHVLLVVCHHLVSDGWSSRILVRELVTLYDALLTGARPDLPPLPLQYADLAVWERRALEPRLPALLSYWTRRLGGAPAAQALPADRPRPALPSHAGARDTWWWPPPLAAGLTTLGRAGGATLFMTLLAAVQTLLYRYSGVADVLVGAPIAGRHRREAEDLIGFFVNTLVLRADLSGRPTFRELLARVRRVALDAYAHQEAPFGRVIEALHPTRHLAATPFANVMLALQHPRAEPWSRSGLSATLIELDNGAAKFDLVLFVSEREGGLRTVVEYATDLFEAATIARLGRHLTTLLGGIVADPDRPIDRLPLLPADERRQLVSGWNATARPYPREACVHHLFETQAALTPDAVALTFEARSLTYRQLDRAAKRLAWSLQRHGVGPDIPVGLVADRSIEMVVGALAILKAGGAYLPLDPAYPAERLRFMIEDAAAPVVLAPAGGGDRWHPPSRVTVLALDAGPAGAGVEAAAPPPVDAGAGHLAYLMYTSGSTGRPKGVMVPHRAIVRLVCHTDYLTVTPDDVVAHASSVAFDATTFELWGSLLHGARLVGLPTDVLLSPSALAAFLRQHGVTVLFLTTALFNQIAREAPDALASVRTVLFGGEAVEPRRVAEVLRHGRPGRLLHVYGPTETTTFASWWPVDHVPAGALTVPIGSPLANTELHVLDPGQEPAPVGVAGELHVGGDGLARGYARRPGLTAERFVPHPFGGPASARLYRTGDLARRRPDGALEFVGRIDHQVKLRGFRIEPGEIESTLRDHPGVQDAVVVVREDSPGDPRLVAYWSPGPGSPATPADLRGYLGAHLPAYMVPSALVAIPALPLTPNGKVDRRALPAPQNASPARGGATQAPRDRLEREVARIWERLLGVPGIGLRDNFFDLGGHSLLAFRLLAELKRRFDREIPMRALFQAPTVGDLAEILRRQGETHRPSLLLPYRPAGPRPPLFCVHGTETLAEALDPAWPFYGLHPHGLSGRPGPRTVEAMAEDYLADIRSVQPEGPYSLSGGSMGGLVAFEMAQQLRARGESVATLVLIDPTTPGAPPSPKALRRIRRTTRQALNLVAQAWLGAGGRVPRELRLSHFMELSLAAAAVYRPRPYPRRATLLTPAGRTNEARDFWRGLITGSFESHTVPGDHFTMFRPPHVATLARHLEEALTAPGPGQGSGR